MKRGRFIVGGGVVIVLVALGLMFIPSYLAKQGLDKLVASLPSDTKFTYKDASVSLFSRSLVLKGVVLHVADPAFDIAADEVRLKDGNPGLDGAVEKAEAAPNFDDKTQTRVAGQVIVTGLHTVYGPLDTRIAFVTIDDPQLNLASLFAPLPALKSANALASSTIGTGSPLEALDGNSDLRQMLQRGARASLAISFDRLELNGIDLTAGDHVSGETVTARMGKTEVDGMDQGETKGATIDDLAINVQDIAVTAGRIRADIADERPFLSDLRDGLPVSTAFSHYPGIEEIISDLAVKRGDTTLVAVDETDLKNVQYDSGIPVSMDLSVKALKVDPAVLPDVDSRAILAALGYTPAVFDFTTSYKLDLVARQATIANTALTLRQGGVLTVDAVIDDIGPDLPKLGAKIASATVHYQDSSLFTRWIDYVSKGTGKDATTVKSGYIKWLELQKPNFRNDKPLGAAIDAAEKFVANPQAMTLTVKPAAPMGLADFDPHHPEKFSTKLALVVTAQ